MKDSECIILNGGVFDKFFNLSYEEQLKDYFYHRNISSRVKYIFEYNNNEKYVILSSTSKYIIFSGNHFYTKTEDDGKFIYYKEKKKIYSTFNNRHTILETLKKIPSFDWLKNESKKVNLDSKLLCNSIVRDILLGKITNVEALVKRYLKTLHIKNLDWKSYLNYEYFPHEFSINWLYEFTTNCETALRIIAKNDDKSDLLKNVILKGMALNMKTNPKWSNKRLNEELKKRDDLLLKDTIERKEQIPVITDIPKFNYPCKLLNNERDVYMEAYEMNHCLYKSYWNKIRTYNYLAFSVMANERFTMGFIRGNTKWEFDQAYAKYDKPISDESKEFIENFLTDINVIKQLKIIFEETEKEIEEESKDLPF